MTTTTATKTKTCPACMQQVPVGSDGKPMTHDTKVGEPCPGGASWASSAPAAGLVGWGLGLVMGAAIPFVVGFNTMLTSTMYSDSDGTGWFVLAALMELAGVLALCIGLYRLVKKADVAFLLAQRHHDNRKTQQASDVLTTSSAPVADGKPTRRS